MYRKKFVRTVQLLSRFYFGTEGTILCFVYGGGGGWELRVCLFVSSIGA
jgi:hypothetical protein